MAADPLAPALAHAAAWLAAADGLLINAGAGIGIDSGLPDFRGPGGFWGVYPALGRARIAFEEIANPAAFASDPQLAWGFYGHRLALYRATEPHAGFALLREIGAQRPQGAFVFTSNVDGQFQKAGYPAARICECHGSIHHLQCSRPCSERIWSAAGFVPEVDQAACRLRGEPPHCPQCGALARPNILMFNDWQWLEQRSAAQQQALAEWLATVSQPVVIEIGAGSRIPSVRRFSEHYGQRLIRINPLESAGPPGSIALPLGGLEGIRRLAAAYAALA